MSTHYHPLFSKTISPNKQGFWQSRGFALVVTGFLLWLIGMINLSSATLSISPSLVWQQLAHWGIAFGISLTLVLIPLSHLRDYAYSYVTLTLLTLALVLLIGDSSGGSQRWLGFGSLRFQPSEIAKLTAALLGARFLSDRKDITTHTLSSLAPLFTGTFLLFFLIFKQPDLGTSGIILLIVASQLICIRMEKKSLLVGQVVCLAALLSSWFFVLKDYQKQRIESLIFPDVDPIGSSYNALQSLIAVGSGGSWGKGFLGSTQSHFQFLPSRHTDFVFSVFAEEHGFWQTLALLMIIGLFLLVCLEIAKHAKGVFATFLALGITAALFLDFAINIAMVIGLFPVVGVPIPFFSYGGSSALKTMLACGLLIKIDLSKKLI